MNDINLNNDLNYGNLLNNKLEQIKNINNVTDNNIELSDKERAGYNKVARGFESMFVHMMLKEMKNAMLDKDNELSMGMNAQPLLDYTDMLISDEVSNTGKGIGIAEIIFKQLSGGAEINNTTSGLKNTNIIQELKNIPKNNHIQENSFTGKVSDRIKKYDNIIKEAANKYGISENLIKSVITAESAGKSDAKSHAGAKGLMQLMDGTAEFLGVKNSYNPTENINGGSKYLSMMLNQFNGDIDLALAAYNAGPGNVEKYSGIPPFKETQNYVKKVKRYLNEYNGNLQE